MCCLKTLKHYKNRDFKRLLFLCPKDTESKNRVLLENSWKKTKKTFLVLWPSTFWVNMFLVFSRVFVFRGKTRVLFVPFWLVSWVWVQTQDTNFHCFVSGSWLFMFNSSFQIAFLQNPSLFADDFLPFPFTRSFSYAPPFQTQVAYMFVFFGCWFVLIASCFFENTFLVQLEMCNKTLFLNNPCFQKGQELVCFGMLALFSCENTIPINDGSQSKAQTFIWLFGSGPKDLAQICCNMFGYNWART